MSDAASPTVSVLIPVLNEEAHLPESLPRMQAQEVEGGFELIFVDGGSSDGTRRLLEEAAAADPRIRLLDNPARRTPNALNIGLAAARGEFVARMDAHTNYPHDYLKLGVERLRRGDYDWVAGPAIAVGKDGWARAIGIALSSRLGTGGARFRHASDEEFEAITGFAGVWRKETLIAHGGWDEDWPINQDSELAARMRAKGERIVCVPAMAADYVPRDSLPALARQYYRYGMYRCKTSGRHPESLRLANLLPPAFAVTLALTALAPRPLRRAARAALALYAGGVAVESARLAKRERDADLLTKLPAVFPTMHLSHGTGFLVGCLKFGPPVAAIARVVKGALAAALGRLR